MVTLKLRGRVGRGHRAATVRTRGRHGRLALLVDLARGRSMGAATIRGAGTPPGRAPGPLSVGLRERCRLTEARPTHRVELVLEAIVAALQPIPLPLHLATSTLGTRQLLAQPRDLVQPFLARQAVRRRALSGHPAVMPEPAIKYKCEIVDRLVVTSPNPLNKDNL